MLRLKLGKLVVSYGDPCERQVCTYYSFYLRQGPPDLNHAAYHVAERECELWQNRALNLQAEGMKVPYEVEWMCQKYERMVRA